MKANFASGLRMVLALGLIPALLCGLTAYFGLYDVAADVPHSAPVARLLTYIRMRSVAVRAVGIAVPRLDSPGQISDGALDYDAMCTSCHLAPGMADNEMRPGLNPKPPTFERFAQITPAEQFWVIKHGIKMTGMSAWGLTHSDPEIWNMVAFLQKLPGLSPGQYKALVRTAQGHHDMDHMDMDHH